MGQEGRIFDYFSNEDSLPKAQTPSVYELKNETSLVLRTQEIQRIRRRNNQRRYRQRQLDLTMRLEHATKQLRGEIERLKREQSLNSTVVSVQRSLWSTVVEYFRLFHHGIRNTTSATQQRVQLDFVKTTMKQDFVFNADRGTDALIRSWMYFPLQFKGFKVTLEELKKQTRRLMVATTTTSVTITEQTLCNVFPHLYRNERDPIDRNMRELFALGDQLLGRRFVMSGSTWILWDEESAQVASITSTSNMLAVMLQLLGNLKNVNRVFEKATISSDFQWRVSA